MIALLVFTFGVYGLQYCGAELVAAAVRPGRVARRMLIWGAGLLLSAVAIGGVPVASASERAPVAAGGRSGGELGGAEGHCDATDRIRTCDLVRRRHALYPAELRSRHRRT